MRIGWIVRLGSALALAAAGCRPLAFEARQGCARDADCPPGASCAAGLCLPCAACAAGEVCMRGLCRPTACGDRPCLAGEACVGGACVAEGCAEVQCPPDQRCAAGTCYPAECAGAPCGWGEVCFEERCVADDCVDVHCPPGQTCAAGRCFPVDCAGLDCAADAVCDDGRCTRAACVGIACPANTLCVAGRCMPLDCAEVRCREGWACVDGTCRDPACYGAPCAAGTYCAESACHACAASETTCDDGVDADCDGAPDCADPECANQLCGAALPCAEQRCSSGRCEPSPLTAGTLCRGSAGDCDLEERCDGSSAECPQDLRRDASVECRPLAGDCDLPEWCDGASVSCPSDSVRLVAQLCRTATGPCQQDALCDGAAPSCPANAPVAAGAVCDPATAGTCEADARCDGASASCPAKPVVSAGTPCRDAAGDCDAQETCDGSSSACPVDQKRPGGTECRASAGDCDQAETCDGLAAHCPDDSLRGGSVVCRASTQACDPAESCSGSSVLCPADVNNCGSAASPFYGLGGSELAPAGTQTSYFSAQPFGVTGQGARAPRLASDSAGNLHLAWIGVYYDAYTGEPRDGAYYRRWSVQEGWEELDDSVSQGVGALVHDVDVAVDSSNQPIVVFAGDDGFNDRVVSARFNGATWSETVVHRAVGTFDFASVATDEAGRAFVAWGLGALLKRWDGAAWNALGTSAQGTGLSSSLVAASRPLVAAAADRPTVAWLDPASGAPQVYLKRWTGSAWEELAGSATGGGISQAGLDVKSHALELSASGAYFVAWESEGDVFLRRYAGLAWEELAGSASAGGVSKSVRASTPELALDAAGTPYLAWRHQAIATSDIYLKRWNGSAWEEVGGSATGGGVSATGGAQGRPALTFDRDGRLVVAWQDGSSGASFIYLRVWDGTSWKELGGGLQGTGLGSIDSMTSPQIAMNAAGDVAVTWSSSNAAVLEVFDGTAWNDLVNAGSAPLAASSNQLAIALDARGQLTAAWDAGSAIYLKRWNGARWAEIGGSATGSGASLSSQPGLPALSLDAAEEPILAWPETTTTATDVWLRHWSGRQWDAVPAGGSAIRTSSARARTVALVAGPSDLPVFAYNHFVNSYPVLSRLCVHAFDGAVWDVLSASADLCFADVSYRYAVAASPSGPIVAWTQPAGADSAYIHLRRWNATASAWEELGGSATGTGLSGRWVDSVARVGVAVDKYGNPVVVWDTDPYGLYGTSAVYLKRWTGSDWEGVAGSDRGDGLSNSMFQAAEPAIAAGGNRLCVVWAESLPNGGPNLVALRCFDQTW